MLGEVVTNTRELIWRTAVSKSVQMNRISDAVQLEIDHRVAEMIKTRVEPDVEKIVAGMLTALDDENKKFGVDPSRRSVLARRHLDVAETQPRVKPVPPSHGVQSPPSPAIGERAKGRLSRAT